MTQKKPRSSVSGRFVKPWVERRYPNTTYIDTIKYPKTKKQA